jgi:hypothetical protein
LHLRLWLARLFPRTPLAVTTIVVIITADSIESILAAEDPAACRVFLRVSEAGGKPGFGG